MRAIDRLKRDHQILRAKLDVLEAALRMGPETWFVLQEVCYTLARQLQDHIRREEQLIATCSQAMSEQTLARLAVEHRDEPQLLRTINRLFVDDRGHAFAQVRSALTTVIGRLCHHMDEEEAELFPRLECVPDHPEEPAMIHAPLLQETMTVNHVLRQHPSAASVFRRLFISIPFEGCDCLDEVAWRHGMESRELLSQLEEALARGEPVDVETGSTGAPCSC